MDCGHNGYLWVHPSAVINIPPGYGNISNTIETPEEEVGMITVSQSGYLVEVDCGLLNSGVFPIRCVSP